MSGKPKKMTTIVPHKAETYAILKVDAGRRRELMEQNIGPGGVSEFDLDRAKIPAGGVTMFELPTLDGEEFVTSIEGVVVGWRDVRLYWRDAFGKGETGPPDCIAEDGQNGVARVVDKFQVGGECAACPFSKFGSAGNGDGDDRAQACQSRRILLLMRPGSLIPLVVSLPPTSVAPARKFFLRLLGNEKATHEVVISIGLEKATNAGGIDYARATFKLVENLDPGLAKQFAEIRDGFGPQMKAAVAEEADVATEAVGGLYK